MTIPQPLIRAYTAADRPAVRQIYGEDEFARPRLLQRYPRMSEYLADEMSYYPDYEPESLFVAELQGQVVGALQGAVDTARFEQLYQRHIRPLLFRRCLQGAYGWPDWLPAVLRTEWAGRHIKAPPVDRNQFPAHLHIGILPAWRRKGLGTAQMMRYADYLRQRNIPGYHLFASSFHPLGLAFYRKLGLELLGQFPWRLHTGYEWLDVTESIFGLRLKALDQ
ncbi:MAG: GNAT family N-acetyltransferase [Anaerolineales bacterium]|nr:GNAT family N-acetyltransferase [Anaerolineales bacterium]